MTIGVLDTTVIVHLIRRYPPAIAWMENENQFSITSITWYEIMVGVPNKQAQATARELLNRFETIYLTKSDQRWAQKQIDMQRFKFAPQADDTLIAAVALRLDVPLYTHNLRHMRPLIGARAI